MERFSYKCTKFRKTASVGDAMLVTRLGVTLYRAGQTVDVELLRPLEDIR